MSMMKKLLVYALTATAAIAMTLVSASACTGLYIGSDYSGDGSTFIARSEDLSNSTNKIFKVSPAGKHKAGDTYEGCYGFSYTFTKDSYSYTAFQDDNLGGVCPDCGQEHDHTPYEAAGTNSKGVSVTATVTVGGNEAVLDEDPLTDEGIEEAEITTILLSEASTAKEGVELLCSIYDKYGTQGGNGVFIADQKETWYIENTTGSQYIAIKLPSSLIFMTPNMSILGEIDLDDENVIASKDLIEVAQKAGTFEGNAKENIINFRASYGTTSINARMWNGLNYLWQSTNYTKDNTTDADFVVSNVKNGAIVAAYSAIKPDRLFSAWHVVDFYKVDGIGNTGNMEYHIFNISSEGVPETAITEWVGMDHGQYGVMVPYFPMLTTETYEGYQVSTDVADYVTEKPDGTTPYYASGDGYVVLPENWEKSYYWSFDALSNAVLSEGVSAKQQSEVRTALKALQQEIYNEYLEMKVELPKLYKNDYDGSFLVATAMSENMASAAHTMALALYDYVANDDADAMDEILYYLAQGDDTFGALSDETLKDFTLPEGYTFERATTEAPKETETVVGPHGGKFQVTFQVASDVNSEHWYSVPVKYVLDNNIFNGYDDSTFRPGNTMTRAMVATVIWRMAGEPTPEDAKSAFTDVQTGTWYSDAIAWASESGITEGKTATTFDPNGAITREEFVTMLYRFADLVDAKLSAGEFPKGMFADESAIHSYAKEAVTWALQYHMLEGYENKTLKPRDTIKRSEAAKILYTFCENVLE